MNLPLSTIDNLFRGDLVEVNPRHFKKGTAYRQRLYYVKTTTNQDNEKIELCNNPYSTSMWWWVPLGDVRLVRRGNWFKYQFNQPLDFQGVAQEAMFWSDQGKMHEATNPQDGLFYGWSYEQALTALKSGTVDAFFYSSGGPGVPPTERYFGGYTFDDPEVAERMRHHSMAMLSQATSV